MTTHAAPLLASREQPELVRMRWFAVLMMAAGACGALAGVFDHPGAFALVLVMPAYVMWVLSDLRVRRVVGGSFAFQVIVSLIPGWGLLLYLVWTRRLVGVLQWLLFLVALGVPAGMAAGLAHGITQVARGGRW